MQVGAPEDLRQTGPFLHPRVVPARIDRRLLLVEEVTRQLGGEVLVERPPQCHVQELHSAADGEHGDAPLEGGPEKVQLHLVAGEVDGPQAGVRLLAVPRGRYVLPSGEH